MKTITINMSDEVYREVRENTKVRAMVGSGHGFMDLVMTRIIQSMENDEEVLHLCFKDKKGTD